MPIVDTEESDQLSSPSTLNNLASDPEAIFDALVNIASTVCNVPIALLTLVDDDRLWLKSDIGLEHLPNTHADFSFCTHAEGPIGFVEVVDASKDPRCCANPLVTGGPLIKYYASSALRLSNGEHVGTLCVLDQQPRLLTTQQKHTLENLTNVAVKMLEARYVTRTLKERESQLSALSESAPLGICKSDITGSCDYVNTTWQTICDMSESEAMGFGWTNAIHPDDKKSVYTEWSLAVSSRTAFDKEFRVKHKNGVIRHVRAISNAVTGESGQTVGFVGSLEDVTSHKIQQEALRKINTLLQQTGTLADVGGWELDLRDDSLIWSDQTCRIHGLTVDYAPHLETTLNFFAPEARPVIHEAVSRARLDGRGWDLELPLIKADGTSIWVRVVGQVELNEGSPARIVGAFQNVTDRVIQQQAIEYAHEQITTATESGNIGVWDWNPDTNDLAWTPKMFALFGLCSENIKVTYELWSGCVHPEDRQSAINSLTNAVNDKQAKVFDSEFRILWPDSSIYIIRATAQITRDAQGNALRFLGVNWDVTPLHTLRTEIIKKHELLQVTLQSIGDAVITADTEGKITWLNPAAEQMTGWLSSDAIHKPVAHVFNIIAQSNRCELSSPIDACLLQEQIITPTDQTILIAKDGHELGIEDSAAPIFDKSGDLLGAILIFKDVTEQRRRTNEMNYRATHDSLTGLVNRIEFESRLQLALDDAHKSGRTYSLMYIDLDQFKLVNDACGHAEGDLLLQQIAKLLSNNVTSKDVVARLGGDEFGVILDNVDTANAQTVAQRICQYMDEYSFVHEERRFRIGTSIGLVPLDTRWTNIEAATQAADSACYAAKDAGRNRVHVWFDTDKLVQARQEDTQWANKLAQAISNNGFVLYAQKITDLSTMHSGVYAEVLIRMDDENGSLIPPNSFLPAAERFSIATRIDSWVLTQVTNELSNRVELSKVDTLCINLSAQSVGDHAFQEKTLTLLAQVGPEVCSCLCFDITETAVVTNFTDVANFIRQIRSLNVRVALDHFGANAPTYKYLNSLVVDFIKVDGEFIKGMRHNPIDASAVRSIVDVAKIMNISTLAAHVDSQETFDLVGDMGIQYAQGFYLHEPERFDAIFNSAASTVID